MEKIGTFDFYWKEFDKHYSFNFQLGKYTNNNRVYICIVYYDYNNDYYDLFTDLTINIPEYELKENEIILNNDISKELLKELEKLGFIKITNKKVNSGFASYEIAKINEALINEYAVEYY